MDCLTTKKIAARCSVCGLGDSTVHMVGTEFYCGRHCPVHEEAAGRLVIDKQPERGVTESLDRELVSV